MLKTAAQAFVWSCVQVLRFQHPVKNRSIWDWQDAPVPANLSAEQKFEANQCLWCIVYSYWLCFVSHGEKWVRRIFQERQTNLVDNWFVSSGASPMWKTQQGTCAMWLAFCFALKLQQWTLLFWSIYFLCLMFCFCQLVKSQNAQRQETDDLKSHALSCTDAYQLVTYFRAPI